jgi:hypothetical protein
VEVERSHLTFRRRQTFHGAWLIVKAENGGYLLGIDGGRETGFLEGFQKYA